MNIIELLVAIAVCGLIVWIILQIPMPAVFKNIIMGVACLVLVIYVLQSLGLLHGGLRLK